MVNYMIVLLMISILKIDCESPPCSVYLGCYRDDPTSRDLPESKILSLVTVDNCVANCAGFSYAGLQYSSECFCGNSYGKYGKLSESECNYKCTGNSSQICGGPSSNSIYSVASIDHTPTSPTTTTAISNNPQWSIFYPPNVLTSTSNQLIRLFEITSSTSGLYSSADYYPSNSRLDVSTLVDSIFDKKSIAFNTTLNGSLIIWWNQPFLSLYKGCQFLANINFATPANLLVLSLPYYQPNTVQSLGYVLPSLYEALVQAGCQSTTTSPTASFSEWGLLLGSSVFSQPSSNPIRIFDLIDTKLYASSNYFPFNQTLEVNFLVSSIYTKRVIQLNNTSSIQSMILTWNTPNLYIFVNCELAAHLGFSDPNELAVMSIPYYNKKAILNGGNGLFYDTVRDTFIKSGCVGLDFGFSKTTTSSTSTTTTPVPVTNQTNTTTPKYLGDSEWSIYFSSSVFTNPGQLVRLFEVSDSNWNVYANADYFPFKSSIEVSILRGAVYSKKYFYISSKLLPISTMIISWKYPTLILTVNCVLNSNIQFTSQFELAALSWAYFKPHRVKSPGYGLESQEHAYEQAGCFTTTTTSYSTQTTSTPVHDSISTIPPNNINFYKADSNLILSIYNTRIQQYQNFLKLKEIFQSYNLLNLITYNLTLIDCF